MSDTNGLWVIFWVLVYFLPTIVAFGRGKLHPGAVVVVNLFLGWTVLGWIIALAMAAGGATNGKDALGRTFPPKSP